MVFQILFESIKNSLRVYQIITLHTLYYLFIIQFRCLIAELLTPLFILQLLYHPFANLAADQITLNFSTRTTNTLPIFQTAKRVYTLAVIYNPLYNLLTFI